MVCAWAEKRSREAENEKRRKWLRPPRNGWGRGRRREAACPGGGSGAEGAGFGAGVAADLAADEGAEIEDEGIADGIKDGNSAAAAGDETGVVEEAELLGDVGLARAGGGDKIGDRAGAGLEDLEEAEPRGFGEGGEEAGNLVELGIREGLFTHIAI